MGDPKLLSKTSCLKELRIDWDSREELGVLVLCACLMDIAAAGVLGGVGLSGAAFDAIVSNNPRVSLCATEGKDAGERSG